MNFLMLIPILFPILSGLLLPSFRLQNNRKGRQWYIGIVIVLNFLITLAIIFNDYSLTLIKFSDLFKICLRIDNLSRFFVMLVSSMWMLVGFYVFEYIKHEKNEIQFYMFYLMTLGVLIGLGFAGNFVTFYMFYEFMTLISYGLAIHSGNETALKAGTKYLVYSFIGAALVLVGYILLSSSVQTWDFIPKGVLSSVTGTDKNFLLTSFFLIFVGFGGKAGMFPLHNWLPTAHPVAPAPASALLSGIITKAGVMGILRTTFYIFGPSFIQGTWVQAVLLIMTLFTVFMGSMLAFKEKLLKKRLAYSTVSQVSYILFGIISLTPVSLLGAFLHMVFHAIIKNILFLVAGSIIYKTGKTYVFQLKGIGKTMPIVMWCFTIASLSLVGIPPTIGVVSKWYLAVGGMESAFSMIGTIGAGILLISALLTAGYLIPIVADGFFPGDDFDYQGMKKNEPNLYMTVPLVVLSVLCIVLGIFPKPLIDFFNLIVKAVF